MAFEGPGRSRARRESRRCCPEARRPPRPGSPTPVPQGWRQRAAPARARLSSPSGALRSRRLQPAGSGSTSSTRPSTSDRRLSRLFTQHMRIHARCSVFRVALFRRAFVLVVWFYLCRSLHSFSTGFMGRWIYTPHTPSSGRRAGTLNITPPRRVWQRRGQERSAGLSRATAPRPACLALEARAAPTDLKTPDSAA